MLTLHLILGGARSGKSRYAEQLAHNLHCREPENRKLIYVATAQANDQEMAQRINQHQADRSDVWQLVEEPICLDKVLQQQAGSNNIMLIDCLTLWLTNCLCSEKTDLWAKQKAAFMHAINDLNNDLNSQIHVFLVSNEVGHGIVPLGQLSRDFVDQSGWLHQELAAIAQQVDFVMAGISLTLKQPNITKQVNNR